MMSLPTISSNTKDWLQSGSWIVTAGGVIIALFKYFSDRTASREQRDRQLLQDASEMRWKQAEAAKKLLDEMTGDEKAACAMRMLDWDGLKYEIAEGKSEVITRAEMLAALRIENLDFSDKEAYVRHCFDALFYFWALFEHYAQSGLVRYEDVAFPNDYYAKLVEKDRPVFDRFFAKYGLTKSAQFLTRMLAN